MILLIAAFVMFRRTKNPKHNQDDAQCQLTLTEVNEDLETSNEKRSLKEMVPLEYHKILPLFCKAAVDKPLPLRLYHHQIPLKEGFTQLYEPIYGPSGHEHYELHYWIEENLAKGFIHTWSSPFEARILLVKKNDGLF